MHQTDTALCINITQDDITRYLRMQEGYELILAIQ